MPWKTRDIGAKMFLILFNIMPNTNSNFNCQISRQIFFWFNLFNKMCHWMMLWLGFFFLWYQTGLQSGHKLGWSDGIWHYQQIRICTPKLFPDNPDTLPITLSVIIRLLILIQTVFELVFFDLHLSHFDGY